MCISKLLKLCLLSYLKDDKKVSKSITTISGKVRIIFLIKKPVISFLNAFLREVHSRSPVCGLNLGCSKGLTASHLWVLPHDDGIIWILEATDHECIYMVSPFLGELVDTCFGDFVTFPMTSVFVKFFQPVNCSSIIQILPIWSDEDLK